MGWWQAGGNAQQRTNGFQRLGQDRKEANTSSEPKKFGNCLSAFALSQAKESSVNWTDRGGRNQERFGSLFVLTAENPSAEGGGGAGASLLSEVEGASCSGSDRRRGVDLVKDRVDGSNPPHHGLRRGGAGSRDF